VAFNTALKWQLITINVMNSVEPIKVEKKEKTVLEDDQAELILDYIKDNEKYYDLQSVLPISIMTGLRRGEVLALRWTNIDFINNVIYVTGSVIFKGNKYVIGETKTKKDRQVKMLPTLIDTLKQLKKKQAEYKLLLGKEYQDNSLVCCWQDGKMLRPDHVTKKFIKLREELNINVRLHDLRHSFATYLLKLGTHPKIVAEILGHSSIRITLDTYSHVIPTMQEEAINKLDDLLFKKREPK